MKNRQEYVAAALRMAIGWHFLYEGVWKLCQDNWSAAGFLKSSEWIAGPLFKAVAANPVAMRAVDLANEWGLVLIGLGLIAGVLSRVAAGAGALMLALFYVCQPPWLNATGDAHYLFLDIRLVEAVALVLLACGPGPGLGDLAKGLWAKVVRKDAAPDLCRREWIGGLASCGVLATFGGLFARWKWGPKVDAVTSATAKAFEFTGLDKLSHPIDQFLQIGQLKLSRLILGGGMISGYAHPRDLKYLSGPNGLMKAYNTPDRTRHTLAFAEKVRTESAPEAALSYGILLSKADRHVEADKILKEAVSLNAKDAARRARAYLWLAKNSEAMTDYHGACAYATVVVTLFDNPEITAEAKKILEEHAEEAK